MLNYTQVFFRWGQIPQAESYQFVKQKLDTDDEYYMSTSKNSLLLTEFIEWNTEYSWGICGTYENYEIIQKLS